jgi:hypothetical protein
MIFRYHKSRPEAIVLVVFVIFFVIFEFHVIFGFYASFLCNFRFFFCFLTYLRLCIPLKKTDLIIIISRKIKLVNLGLTSTNPFAHTIILCSLLNCCLS